MQDVVELVLMEQGHYDLAKKYILYRQKHKERRDAKNKLMETYQDIFFSKSTDSDMKRENANINADAPMGIMLKCGAEGAKQFVSDYIIKPEHDKADREHWFHIHELVVA